MIQKKRWLPVAFLGAAALVAASLNTASAAVVTSVRPLGFIAAAIADGVTPTEVLLPDGASEHDYALRPSDVLRINKADLVVWVGPEMEAFMTKSLAQQPASRQLSLAALPTVKPLLVQDAHDHDEQGEEHDDHGAEAAENHAHGHDEDHHHGEYNMHLWLSPKIAKQAAIAIHDKLIELMPQNKDKLDANLREFTVNLAQSQQNIATMLAPVQNKGYFVFHDAYTYFEKQFGLSPLGYFTVNPEIQPGAQRLHHIRTELVERKAVCVFAEPQFRPAVITAVAQGTGVKMGTLDPLGSGLTLDKQSYMTFLSQIARQYVSCLE
ncbi:zinc ABC transporter substrate-binding protein ZnuA [Nissabacter sp. SGAir0207]|uniref:zinc ABC transporter substrate-binding protein ZnuA n=1 Tax=Nissabacter sp. SGAir0207 TaxID=2126321 RepID=UPI0010CD4FDF|nr:zinc ABC transporter substrate-binding protein ZnuA [Nissabacter sp. SGAir0207]QCR35965.1 zinc ABC transporter substrate-binding protein [Nissabacter sp. SGAir0207]